MNPSPVVPLQWDPIAVTLVIAAFGSMVTGVVGAVFAGIAMLRAGRASARVDQVGSSVADIQVKTDGTLTRLSEQNRLLAEELKAVKVEQLASQGASLQLALARVQMLEAEVVKRADAAPPVLPVPLPVLETLVKPVEHPVVDQLPQFQRAVDDARKLFEEAQARLNETIEHDRRNRKAGAAALEAAIASLKPPEKPEPPDAL